MTWLQTFMHVFIHNIYSSLLLCVSHLLLYGLIVALKSRLLPFGFVLMLTTKNEIKIMSDMGNFQDGLCSNDIEAAEILSDR